jgi:hypothetical protein
MKKFLRNWLPLAIVIVGLCFLNYASVQHSLRSSANDPQIQLAQDAARSLGTGAKVADLTDIVPTSPVDVTKSLAPFVNFYDENGKFVGGNGNLGMADLPFNPPIGVFDYTRRNGEDRVTRQIGNTRVALVVIHYGETKGEGFVVAGRNLREVEKRENDVLQMSAAMTVGLLVVTAAIAAILP